jgi:hypothetical protein
MTRKVIYASFVHLTDKTSRDWYLDYLISKNVAVEYWDVVALVREEYDEPVAKATEYLRTFQTYTQLQQMLCLPENQNSY